MDEQELLSVLVSNARRSTEDIARLLDEDEADVAAAIDKLETDNVIGGYQTVIDWDRVDDDHVRAEVECNVTLDRETSYDDIADRIARYPEVVGLELVSGEFDFLLRVECSTMRSVSEFVSDEIAPLPEVTRTVTHFVMNSYKERGVRFDDDDDDDRLSVTP